jgi:branched-subunit amino acid ABC-type transport system permease component
MPGVPTVTSLLPYLIAGLMTGALYGLAGLGLVLTYRTSGVFNFAHGATAAAAAFVFWELHLQRGMPWPLAALLTIALFGAILGLVLERLSRGLADASAVVPVVATLGLFLAIQGYLAIQFGAQTRLFPDFLPTSGFTVDSVFVTWAQSISFGIACTASAGLYLYLRSSRLGVAMRASVDNPVLLTLSGERPNRIRRASWVIGSSFAATSGILLAPTLGLDAVLLTFLVVQAFGACAVGRFSNLPLTFVGGLLIGVAASLSTKYFTQPPWSGIPTVVPILVLIAVLVVVPARRFPQRRASRRALITPAPPLSPRVAAVLAVVAVPILLVLPFASGTRLPVWTSALIYAIIFGSLGMLVWGSGQISLCHMSFAALGATAMAHLTSWGIPWLPALVLAGLLTVPIGALVAIPGVRLSGLYLALVTLGFGIVMQNVIFGTSLMFGGSLTVRTPRPQLGFIDGNNDKWMYFIVLAVAVTCFAVIALLLRSRLGRLLTGIAESPTMLSTHGMSVPVTLLIAFCTSAFFAGIGGALLLTQYNAATGLQFGPVQSLLLVAVLTICGTRPLRGAILAALLYSVLPGYLTSFDTDRQTLAFGIVTVIAAILVAHRAEIRAWCEQQTLGRTPYRPTPRAISNSGRHSRAVTTTGTSPDDMKVLVSR